MHGIKNDKKTLTFNNIRVNKKKFHMSKKGIDLMSVNVNKIVAYDKFNHNEDCFKYFIGYYQKVKLLDHYILFYLKWVGI